MALLDLDENTDPEVYFGEVQELIQENQPKLAIAPLHYSNVAKFQQVADVP